MLAVRNRAVEIMRRITEGDTRAETIDFACGYLACALVAEAITIPEKDAALCALYGKPNPPHTSMWWITDLSKKPT